MNQRDIFDLHFLEFRANILEAAAFLDRLDRADNPQPDHRMSALHRALEIIADNEGRKTGRILEALSDMTSEPAPSPDRTHPTTGAAQ